MRKLVLNGLFLLLVVVLLAVIDTEEKQRLAEVAHKPLTIYQFDRPEHQAMLNTPTKPVRKLPDRNIDALIHSMESLMSVNVAGISANQVGKSVQLFLIAPIISTHSSMTSDVYINPVITKVSRQRICFWHGCLSAKGKPLGKTATWRDITIEAKDARGNVFTRELTGLSAIVAQHEFRHLLGGGYHDHAKQFDDEMALMRLVIQKKERMVELCSDEAPFLLEDYEPGESIEAYAKRKGKKHL